MLYIESIAIWLRNVPLRGRSFLVVAIFGMTLLAFPRDSTLFPLAAAQSTTNSSEDSTIVQTESNLSVEGSLSIAIFVLAALLLVRWALREKPQPGKRYHRSFAPLHEDGSEKRDRHRAEAPDQAGEVPESGGGHGGSE